MTPRSFWIIVIKVIGIWFILDSIQILYQYLTYLPVLKDAEAISLVLGSLAITTIVLALFFSVLYLCLYKTDWIIDKLNLDKGFKEEKFELNIHRSSIYTISIIVIGGMIFVKSFPQLCKQLILYFQKGPLNSEYSSNPIWSFVLLNFIESLIGIYFITSSRTIVNFIEHQRRKSNLPSNSTE